MVKEEMPNPTYLIRDSFGDTSVSSRRQRAPSSVPTTASLSDIPATQVNTQVPNDPRRQFRPESAFGARLGEPMAGSAFRRDFDGDTGLVSGRRHTFTCRTPTVTRLCPAQPMWRTMLMHLFVECSLADPVFRLTAHTKRKPSFTSPRVARYWELGLKETLRTPTVCSVRIDRGISGDASFAVEKIKTRGLYPVSPTARNLPFGLIDTLVTAFILSLDDQDRGLLVSGRSLDGDPLWVILCAFALMLDIDFALVSGVDGGVDWL